MKKHLFILFSVCLLCACSKDDPESSNGDNGGNDGLVSFLNNAVFTTNDGEKVVLSSIDDCYSFLYDNRGYVTRVDDFIIDYDDMVIYDREDPDEKVSFTLNNQGFVASIKHEISSVYSHSSYKYTFSYDSNGHMTAWSFNDKTIYYGDDKDYSYTANDNGSFIWKNDKITKATYNYSSYDEYSNRTSNETGTCIPEYKVPNKLAQYTINFAELINEDFEEFILVGLFGKPCSYLPSSLDWTYVEKDGNYEDVFNNYCEYDYIFNNDGTIACEYEVGDEYGYEYSYSPFNHQSRSMTELSDVIPNMSKKDKVRKHSIKDRINSRHNRISK